MNSAIERLISLRASDIMRRDVVTISANQSMERAARTFLQSEITGAPVVDEQGHCVGVLSAVDFVRRSQQAPTAADPASTSPDETDHVLVQDGPRGTLHIDESPHDQVRSYMTTGVQSATTDTSLLDVARMMCNEHIHRLVVLDDRAHPIGVITSLDLVAAVAQVIEE